MINTISNPYAVNILDSNPRQGVASKNSESPIQNKASGRVINDTVDLSSKAVETLEEHSKARNDAQKALTEKIIKAIKSVGGDSPKFLINTHYHGDHTGGNEKLGKEGTLIFSHDNVRKSLKTGSFIKAFNMNRAGVTLEGLPVVTFSEDISFHLNGSLKGMIKAVDRVLSLADDSTKIIAGHGNPG